MINVKNFSKDFLKHYESLKKMRKIEEWYSTELKTLELSIAPSTVQVFGGKLKSIAPIRPDTYLIKKEGIEYKYKRLKKRIQDDYRRFTYALLDCFSDDDLTRYDECYAGKTADLKWFYDANKKIEEYIDAIKKFEDIWED